MNAPTPNQPTDKNEKFANASQKLKEVQANSQIQRYCTTFNFAQRSQVHPSPKKIWTKFVHFKNICIFGQILTKWQH